MRSRENKSQIHLPEAKGLGIFMGEGYRVVGGTGEGDWGQEKGEVISILLRCI